MLYVACMEDSGEVLRPGSLNQSQGKYLVISFFIFDVVKIYMFVSHVSKS